MSFFGQILRRLSPKPRKQNSTAELPAFAEEPHCSASLVKGSFLKFVARPPYVDELEWLMVHTFDFFHLTNLFYSSVVEFCQKDCIRRPLCCGPDQVYSALPIPASAAGSDPQSVSSASSGSACQQIDTMLAWIQHQIDQEKLFPVRSEEPISTKDTINTTRLIFLCLYRILSHIYFCHYNSVLALGEGAHLNTLFSHFMAFALIQQPPLLEKKEWQPMRTFLVAIKVVTDPAQ